MATANTPAFKAIPLMALVGKKRTILLDAATVASKGFDKFVARYRSLLMGPGKGLTKIPDFEIDRLGDDWTKLTDAKIGTMACPQPKGYPSLLQKLKAQNAEKGHFCFVTGNKDSRTAVVAAARQADIYVQLFAINDDGEIGTYQAPPKPETKSPEPRKEPRKEPRATFHIATQPERIKVEPLRTALTPAPGAVVYDSKRQPVALGALQMKHSNAQSFATDRPGVTAKVYNPPTLTSLLRDKCLRMLQVPLRHKGLCWPLDALYDAQGVFVGYLMPTPQGKPLHLSVFKQAGLKKEFPTWNKLNLCRLATTIMGTIKFLHANNVLMGCVNPSAIRVAGDSEVYFVDTDNYQIDGFPTLLYNTSFTPPELLGRPIYLASLANENYAVALLAFMLMMPGKLPYVIDPERPAEESIRRGRFPFPFGNVHGDHANPGMWRFMWSHLSPFKHLFYHTFQKGGDFNAPEARKAVGAFLATLRNFTEELEHPSDPESLSLTPRTFKRVKGEEFHRCSCCGIEHPRFYFYRERVGAGAVCNGCIDKRSNESFTCRGCGKTYYYSNRLALFHSDMRQRDSDWRKQKYCADCKNRTDKCMRCGKEVPTYEFDAAGRCRECQQSYRNDAFAYRTCCDCGREFVITNGEHEFAVQKGMADPKRCKPCRDKRKNK